MSDFGAISKFSGNENDKNSILNVMSQYEAFVTASLQSRPGVTEDMIDGLLITYFIFVLKDEAIQFYTQLVGGQVPWRRSADGDRQLSDTESSAKTTSWSEMKTAFEASYLSADALARSVERIVTLTQDPNESVTSYVNRLRDSFNSLNRQVQKHVQPVEALQTGNFERGLRPEILELQRIGQYCKSMQQAVDRTQRSAASLAAVDGTVSAMSWSIVARGRSRAQVRAVRGPESRLERKRSHSGSRKNHGSAAAASHLSSSKMPAAKSSTSRLNITRNHSPCSVSGCTARDKSRHASNGCFNHPLLGEANLARYRERRARRQKST